MARQSSLIKLEGTIGDVTFYKSKDGFLARTKGGVSKDRIKNDPAFQRTRENGAEFGKANQAGRHLRTAIRPLLLRSADSRMSSRLSREMMQVLKLDNVNSRGQRQVLDENLQSLVGFDFNNRARLNATVYADLGVNVDRVTGEISVSLDSFVPEQAVAMPKGGTHLRFVTGSAAIDLGSGEFQLDIAESPEIEMSSTPQAATTIETSLEPNSERSIFVVFGVEFFQEVNGNFYSLKNGAHNSLNLIEIDIYDGR